MCIYYTSVTSTVLSQLSVIYLVVYISSVLCSSPGNCVSMEAGRWWYSGSEDMMWCWHVVVDIRDTWSYLRHLYTNEDLLKAPHFGFNSFGAIVCVFGVLVIQSAIYLVDSAILNIANRFYAKMWVVKRFWIFNMLLAQCVYIILALLVQFYHN